MITRVVNKVQRQEGGAAGYFGSRRTKLRIAHETQYGVSYESLSQPGALGNHRYEVIVQHFSTYER